MKIAFVQEFLGPQFGIMYIASVLKQAGYNCEVFVRGLEKDIVQAVSQSNSDLIGFSCVTGFHRWVEEKIIEIKKEKDIPIIVGGPHPTYFPEMIFLKAIDGICLGEGESAVLEFVKKFENQQDWTSTQNFWFNTKNGIKKNPVRDLINDLDPLPFPDREIYDKYTFFKTLTEIPINISRGCPYRCYFCYNPAKQQLYKYAKTYTRWRSAGNVIRELQILLRKYPRAKSVIISDDIIEFNKVWITEFSRGYKEKINLPFFASIRPDFIDKDTIRKLKEANCFCLSIGIETGNERLRREVLGKTISNDSILRAGRLIKESGIKLRTSNMFFIPSETINDAFETVKINIRIKTDYPWAYMLQPYPGTTIYEYAREILNNKFSVDTIDPLGLSKPCIRLKDGGKILVVQRLFYYAVKIPGFFYLLKILVYVHGGFIFDTLQKISILFSYSKYHHVSLSRSLFIAIKARQYLNQRGNLD